MGHDQPDASAVLATRAAHGDSELSAERSSRCAASMLLNKSDDGRMEHNGILLHREVTYVRQDYKSRSGDTIWVPGDASVSVASARSQSPAPRMSIPAIDRRTAS